jgi:two-component system, NarL family, nitrate/nitrite response regulator NarL
MVEGIIPVKKDSWELRPIHSDEYSSSALSAVLTDIPQTLPEDEMFLEGPRLGVLIVDDHPVVRLGLRTLLEAEPEFAVVGEAADGRDAINLAQRLEPDVIVLDLLMPRVSGLDVLRELTETHGRFKVIVLTASIEKQQLVDALQLGARGVILKDSVTQELVRAIHAVSEGQYWIGQQRVGDLVDALERSLAEKSRQDNYGLTPRELQILPAIVEGCTNKDIAQRFSISEDTVKRHLTNIFDKLGVSSRLELGLFAINHRLVDNP